jgi:hypothetical protein
MYQNSNLTSFPGSCCLHLPLLGSIVICGQQGVATELTATATPTSQAARSPRSGAPLEPLAFTRIHPTTKGSQVSFSRYARCVELPQNRIAALLDAPQYPPAQAVHHEVRKYHLRRLRMQFQSKSPREILWGKSGLSGRRVCTRGPGFRSMCQAQELQQDGL